jgi:catechol 2,3-dioxygenase-like lactoylglutathione lyase family enzyme
MEVTMQSFDGRYTEEPTPQTAPFSGFSVDDLEAARAFYGETLGLKVTESMGNIQIWLTDTTFVFAYAKPGHVPATFTVLNFPVADIEAAVDDLARRGVAFERYQGTELEAHIDEKGICRDTGPLIAWFTDPAGNVLSVIQGD